MLRKDKIYIIYIHIIMMFYSWLKTGLFQASDNGGLLFLVISSAYFIFYFYTFLKGRCNTIFYGIISILAIVFLFTWAIPGPSEKLIVWFLSFPAWPILATAYYLNSYGLSWKLLLAIYLLLVAVSCLLRYKNLSNQIK